MLWDEVDDMDKVDDVDSNHSIRTHSDVSQRQSVYKVQCSILVAAPTHTPCFAIRVGGKPTSLRMIQSTSLNLARVRSTTLPEPQLLRTRKPSPEWPVLSDLGGYGLVRSFYGHHIG